LLIDDMLVQMDQSLNNNY